MLLLQRSPKILSPELELNMRQAVIASEFRLVGDSLAVPCCSQGDIVPLKVDWESWGKCVPGSLSRHDRAGMAGHIFNLEILRSTTLKLKPRNR